MGLPEDFPTRHYFPLPIGGIPDHNDFIPSLLFIACYLVPFVLAVRKALTPGKRTTVTINSTLVPIERMVILSFRTIMSRDNNVGEESRKNWAMFEFTQTTTGLSTFALLDEVSRLLGSLCLLATRDNVPYDEWKEQTLERVQGRAEERKRIRSASVWFTGTLALVTTIQWTVPNLCPMAATTQGAVKWVSALRFLGHAFGAGYAVALVLGCIRAEREVASLKIELARTFRRQAMMIFLVLFYRCLVSFTSTNDLTHPTNDPLATISKVFFYLTQLPLELAICWNHASTDYRKVVDAGARGDGPRNQLENGKKAKKKQRFCLKDSIISKMLRFKRQHRMQASDSASDVIPLTRVETPTQFQTPTIVSVDAGDVEKQGILFIPSISSRSSTLGTMSADRYSTFSMEKQEKEQRPSSLVEDVRVWTPRRSIWHPWNVW